MPDRAVKGLGGGRLNQIRPSIKAHFTNENGDLLYSFWASVYDKRETSNGQTVYCLYLFQEGTPAQTDPAFYELMGFDKAPEAMIQGVKYLLLGDNGEEASLEVKHIFMKEETLAAVCVSNDFEAWETNSTLFQQFLSERKGNETKAVKEWHQETADWFKEFFAKNRQPEIDGLAQALGGSVPIGFIKDYRTGQTHPIELVPSARWNLTKKVFLADTLETETVKDKPKEDEEP